jgi:hypothetical protein
MALLTNSGWFVGNARRGLALALAGLGFSTAAVAATGIREDELKAAALFNVIAFTEWPATAFASADAPLVVGVLGNGPLVTFLNDTVAHETWQGRRISLRRVSTPADARFCHAVYIAQSEHARWPSIAHLFARLPILTISDADEFARRGGLVQLTIERNKVQLLVNLRAARSCGITISSKVLRLANVLDDRTP